ncbi:MAG: GNAT family N-acetyltransferase [Actinomycetota bacterium]
MDIKIRQIKKKELPDFVRVIEHAFGMPMRASDIPTFARKIDVSRMHAAFDDEDIVGTAGVYPFTFHVPGGDISAAGVTMVGVLPSHRRKGILRNMMRVQLDDIHKRNEPIAVLWASEESIYQRFGYGLAAHHGRIDIESDRTGFLNDDGPVGRIRMVAADEALKILPSIYERVRANTVGMYERSPAWWEVHSLYDPEHIRHGASHYFFGIFELDGVPEGYIAYRIRASWEDDSTPSGKVEVSEAFGTSPVAIRELWRYAFGIDLVTRIQAAYLPSDFPLLLMMQEPRRLRFSLSDTLWLRVVDVAAALEARSYETHATLTFDVSDEFCEWNTGRWKLDAKAGKVTRTKDDADIACSINELGATYLGETTFTRLADAGRVRELRPGAIREADAMFRRDRAPWIPENF